MGNKLALILSLGIIFFAFLFGADLTMIQVNYTNLDSFSTTVSYRISKEGNISDELKDYCLNNDVLIEAITDQTGYQAGDVFEYKLMKNYTPIVLSDEPFIITIKRYAVISIYN